MALLGIDFGTASLRAVKLPEKGPPKPSDVVTAPAIASFHKGNVTVGEPVLMMAGAVEDTIVHGVKRLLGRTTDDALVKRVCERIGLAVHAHGGGDLELRRSEDDDAGVFGMSVSSSVTDLLRYICEHTTGARGAHEAVIAVPSWFEEEQRKALLTAATRAEIRVVRFMRDTVASALWASHAQRIGGAVAVVDVGAGGIGAAIVNISDVALTLVASRGSTAAAGDDIDAELVAAAHSRTDRQTRELLRQACESMKRELAGASEVRREVNAGGKTHTVVAERWELELLLAGLAKNIAQLCDRVLGEAKLEGSMLQAVLACGGMTKLSAVAGRIAGSLGPCTDDIETLDGVVLGAGLRAAVLKNRVGGLDVVDGEDEPEAEAPKSKGSPRSRKRSDAWMSAAKVTMRRKPIQRRRPEVTRRRVDPTRTRKRKSTIPPGPTAVSPEPPSVPDEDAVRAVEAAAVVVESVPPAAPQGATGPPAPSGPPTVSTPPPAASEPPPSEPAPSEPPTNPVASREREKRKSDKLPGAGDKPDGPETEPTAQASTPSPSSSPPDDDIPDALPTDPGVGVQAAPSSDPPSEVRVESAKPLRKRKRISGGLKYPARDGQAKYPAIDRRSAESAPPAKSTPPARSAPPAKSPPPAKSAPPPQQVSRRTPALFSTTVDDVAKAVKRQTKVGMRKVSDAPAGPVRHSPVSLPPANKRNTIPAPQMPRAGTLYVPRSAEQIMKLAITRRMEPEDLEPIAPPVLLRRLLGRRSVSGSLIVISGKRELHADIDCGNAKLTRGEHTELMQMFSLDDTKWRYVEDRVPPIHGRELYPLPRIALEGLRRLLRGIPADELAAAMGQEQLALAPKLRPDQATVPKRLNLSGRERRFIEDCLDGETSGKELSKSKLLGASTCLQLLALLELYGTLDWSAISAS